MKSGIIEHPRTILLAERLGVPVYVAVGILEVLRQQIQKTIEEDIGEEYDHDNAWTPYELETVIGWNGEPGELHDALVAFNWIEGVPSEQGGPVDGEWITIRDWDDFE